MNRVRLFFKTAVARLYRWLVPPYQTEIAHEHLPKRLRKRTLYVLEDDGYREQAAMLCPCGCKRILHMNLLPDDRPCWRLTTHQDGTATLHPSVWRQKDCGSHFWFRNGYVEWCSS
jgi:hypothetical protein